MILTKSASDLVPIFFMTRPRWIFTVISAMPSSAAICLFMSPAATKSQNVPLARRQGLETRACTFEIILSSSRLFRSRSIAVATASSISWWRNGLVKKSIAPAFMALTVIGISP